MRKSNHRAAFASDPKFLERIARQLQSEPTSTPPSPADKKPSKAVQRLENSKPPIWMGGKTGLAWNLHPGY